MIILKFNCTFNPLNFLIVRFRPLDFCWAILTLQVSQLCNFMMPPTFSLNFGWRGISKCVCAWILPILKIKKHKNEEEKKGKKSTWFLTVPFLCTSFFKNLYCSYIYRHLSNKCYGVQIDSTHKHECGLDSETWENMTLIWSIIRNRVLTIKSTIEQR